VTSVVNTSPVIFLTKVDALHFLKDCFSEIFVPDAVVEELADVRLPSFIRQTSISPSGKAFVQGMLGRLHRGELEVMVLARELDADFVVIDDLLARRKAQRLGLGVIGTVGVLLLAHQQGALSSREAERKLTELVERHGMYLSLEVLGNVLEALHR
jgi:predicted nucleic acid-binding protein